MNAVNDVLRRFSEKRATGDEVMRALVTYDGWFAPGGWAAEAFGTDQFERACIWGAQSTIPPGQLWLFTDADGGPLVQARGGQPGFYVGPLRGSTLFEKLPEGISQIEVNPCAPPDKAWFIGAPGVPFARNLGRALALEQALMGGANVVDRLLDYSGYLAFLTPSGTIATAVGAGGMQNPGMIFTAPDCRDAALAKIGGAAAQLKQTAIDGASLFGQFDKLGIDGLVVNIAGPGTPKALTREMCQGIAQSLQSRAELARLEARARELADET
jgi:hypothetical protein